jgi:uroporphyrinogen decarboxylase
MDSNWTDFLDYFTDFPKGRCMYDSDGFTDLEKIRDTLGGRMAFTGNIPPAIMSFGTPDENYKIVKDQIEKMGDSFVAAPSCSLAPNMPRENLEAFYAAIDEL